jgi:three-Cys-motif partner protein
MQQEIILPRPVQKFGGPWSLIKTDMVSKYIRFFNTALKSRPFEKIYIDAFAGSGAFRYVDDAPINTLFGPRDESEDIHAGSAQLALRADPPFDRIFFIEKDKENVEALQELITRSGHGRASVERGDANEILRKLCRRELWKRRRGVIFLDPFGMNVDWSTLKMIANTGALDLWFLFALAGTVRNLPRLASRLDAGKRAAVTRVLGTEEWFEEFYTVPNASTATLFDTSGRPPLARRTASVDDIESYVRRRLLTIFPHVERPRRLKAPGNKSLFSLFFAVSNPSEAAITLARKGASHILKGG